MNITLKQKWPRKLYIKKAEVSVQAVSAGEGKRKRQPSEQLGNTGEGGGAWKRREMQHVLSDSLTQAPKFPADAENGQYSEVLQIIL